MALVANVRIAARKVFFHPENGDPIEVEAEKEWPQAGRLPLLNLSNGKTSVPHRSAVVGASSYFWTFTRFGDESEPQRAL